ncbi:MAG: isopentenyl-diphosphate Delta-isomerase [Lachnospiraceae bacterium]|nr:isopentenyl-diphosphate Delta-isomerase [Lachnospiraceae bacterium]
MRDNNDLILVDMDDKEKGFAEKLDVHKRGLLHRAFSVFLYDGDRLLIQRRAEDKYHSAGLWANTCCSHPRGEETVLEAAAKRLLLECGIENADLHEAGKFVYHAVFSNGLTEYEMDHVIVGEYSGSFKANPEEASELRYVRVDELKHDMENEPDRYAVWLFTALGIAESYRKGNSFLSKQNRSQE